MSAVGVIHLTGVVPPMRFIVVDRQGDITEITSNTLEDVKPKVFLGSLQSGVELPLTPELQSDFAAKTKGLDLSSMDKHFSARRNVAAATVEPADGFLLIRQLSWLRLPHALWLH